MSPHVLLPHMLELRTRIVFELIVFAFKCDNEHPQKSHNPFDLPCFRQVHLNTKDVFDKV